MKIHTVAVLGAGAVGCYFLDSLKDKLCDHLWTVASGERKTRLQKEGLFANGKRLPLHLKTPEEAHGADLLIVTVKYTALSKALDDIAQVTDEHTIVLSPMNGVDSEEIIGQKIGPEHLVYSLIKISSERRDGNQICFNPLTTAGLYIGEKDPGAANTRLSALCELFEGSGLHYQISGNILLDIWEKYALNISRNLPQAMVGCCNEAYEKSSYVLALSQKLRHEVVLVANAKGIPLVDENDTGKGGGTVLPTARFSTLQDLDAGRHTEIDMFSGAMIKMGQELSIPVPYNEFAYYMIKALEQKNDGIFLS